MAEEQLFFLHRRPDIIAGSELISEGIYWGGDFQEAVRAYNNNSLDLSDIKVFVGYCGWEAGDLEGEVEEGSWRLDSLQPEALFSL